MQEKSFFWQHPESLPQGILRAEQSHASKRCESFGPLAEKKIKANLNYTVFILRNFCSSSGRCTGQYNVSTLFPGEFTIIKTKYGTGMARELTYPFCILQVNILRR